jgi:hypothetical protein
MVGRGRSITRRGCMRQGWWLIRPGIGVSDMPGTWAIIDPNIIKIFFIR